MNKRFVLQRLDTGEYYKTIKSGYLKNWPPDDPRRKSWTPILDQASFYTETGIKSIAGHHRNSRQNVGVSFVVVELYLAVSGVRDDL